MFDYILSDLDGTITNSSFPFIYEKGHIISLVGAGGKTSLMYNMAKKCADNGMKVLVSTTTHIMKPNDGSYVDNGIENARKMWKNGQYVTIGQKAENGKISMLPENELNEYIKEADISFLEADGSKHLPIKVPNETEPVIIDSSDIVIAVCGMSGLGKTFGEACFRLEEAQKLLGKTPSDIIEISDVANILTSENGSHKNVGDRDYYIVLNQCDNIETKRQAKEIIAEIKGNCKVAGCLKNIVTMSIDKDKE